MNQLPQRPKTILTRLMQNGADRIQFAKIKLKENARVPELRIQGPDDAEPQVYPLLGDKLTLGRSSKTSDIVIANPVVSTTHAVVSRDRKPRKILGIIPGRQRFVIRDENSTNGIYKGKKRLRSSVLYHGDILNLAPTDLEGSVQVEYYDPPIWYMRVLRMGVYGLAGISTLIAVSMALAWTQFSVYPIPNTVQGPTIVYANDGQTPLTPVPVNRSHVDIKSLANVSKFLPKAVMASEDIRFYWHLGVDPLGTTRAIVTNFRSGGIREGASTITQQLARNVMRDYVGTEDSAGRKFKEAMVALKLEATYSKDELMRLYLSRVYLGFGNFGFEDAAQFYFGKSVKDLDLNESATLAGILPAPNAFNPVKNYDTAVEYRNRVLERMAEYGMVSPEEASRARRSRIDISPAAQKAISSTIAPYYYSRVLDEISERLGKNVAEEGNFIVTTAMDPKMQRLAEKSLQSAIESRGGAGGYSQGAIITLNAETGEILALVGGYDYKESQFNRATQALRQPGSTFKIFTYTAALEQGASPSSTYSCAPFSWDGQDYGSCGGGMVDMQTAVTNSYNPVALRVAKEVGLDRVVDMAKRMGITSNLNAVPGLVLGQSEVTVLEMTSAFGILANSGVQTRSRTIQKIIDSGDCQQPKLLETCRVIYPSQRPEEATEVVKPEIANQMTTMLQGVVRSGTGRAAAIGLGEAGKTGTTNSGVDLWFIGYVPSRKIVTGVWLGNDNNDPTGNSSAEAAQLWGDYMRQAMR
jgi:1A family penicillin-binding protein